MTKHDLLNLSEAMTLAPQVACKLTRLLKGSYATEELAEVARYDAHLTGRLLQVCNGSQYRGRHPVSSLSEAITRLGKETFKRILWQTTMSGPMSRSLASYRLDAGANWRHSVRAAFAAEELLKILDLDEERDLAFTAGLLHDVGKILVNRVLASHAGEFYQYLEENQIPAYQAETKLLGFNHAEIGGGLLTKWEQDEALVAAVSGHHEPERSTNERFASLINLASTCARHYDLSDSVGTKGLVPEIDDDIREILKVDDSKLVMAMEKVQSRSEEVEVLMAVM